MEGMARILIIGGGGMVGQKLARLLDQTPIDQAGDTITLFDRSFPSDGASANTLVTGDVVDVKAMQTLLSSRFDVIFHLASVVSGEAEADFRVGYDTNLTGFWNFLSHLEAEHTASDGNYRPRVVFTSSIAVFGPPFPVKIGDDFPVAPQTSYGAQKAVSELLVADLDRRGIIEGLAIRLPTICVRPGRANLAASSFFSGIIREPLNGEEAILPVPTSVRHWHASPRSAAGFLRHAGTLDLARRRSRAALNLPGVSCTVEEQIEALRDVAGNKAVALIRSVPDETIMRIVSTWPRDFDPVEALSLGFRAETSFREIIEHYIQDDLTDRSL